MTHSLHIMALQCKVPKLSDVTGLLIPFSKKIDMSIDPFSGRNPSYCFVDLQAGIDAASAMEALQGQLVRERPIRVRLDTREGHESPVCKERTFVFDRWARSDAKDHWIAPTEEGRRLWVGGLPWMYHQYTVNVEMKRLFQGWNITAVSKLVPPVHARAYHIDPKEAGLHCYCFVDFASTEDAEQAAVTLNGTDSPHGGRWKINVAKPVAITKVQREQLGMRDGQQQALLRQRNLNGDWRVRGTPAILGKLLV